MGINSPSYHSAEAPRKRATAVDKTRFDVSKELMAWGEFFFMGTDEDSDRWTRDLLGFGDKKKK